MTPRPVPFDLGTFLDWLSAREDAPYIWGGRGSVLSMGAPSPYEGWDCWGLVACGVLAAGGPDLREWWTDRAWADLTPVASPIPGTLAFYAPASPRYDQDVEHVEVVMSQAAPLMLPGGALLSGWRTIGTRGGNHLTTSLAMAQSQDARVRYRDHHLTRARFAGFRSLDVRR